MKYLLLILLAGCIHPRYQVKPSIEKSVSGMDKKYEYIVGTDHKYFIVASWDGVKEKWVYWKKRGNIE